MNFFSFWISSSAGSSSSSVVAKHTDILVSIQGNFGIIKSKNMPNTLIIYQDNYRYQVNLVHHRDNRFYHYCTALYTR